MIHSFLMLGQSNMAGRGFKEDVEPINNPNLFVLRNGRWQNMYVPVNCDRPFSGVSLAESFADEYSKAHKGVSVGLIPCADGGTTLNQWKEGGLLFDNAIYAARLASRTSDVAGILWHQGEVECGDKSYPLYSDKITAIIRAFRKESILKNIPFIMGGLGEFLVNREDYSGKNYTKVNEAIKTVAECEPNCGFVSADGLKSNPDNLHFCSKSLREFGKRYFREYNRIADPNMVFTEKPREDGAVRSVMELL